MSVLRQLRHLLRGTWFRRLFAVRLASQLTDGVFQVALASYTLFSPEQQPSPAALAGVLAVALLPFSLLGPFVGVFLDRWPRRQVLLWANLLRSGLVAGLAGLVLADVRGPGLYAAILVCLSVNRFLLAGLSAALPHTVDRDDLVTANALTPTAGTLAFLVGSGAGFGVRSAFVAVDLPGDPSVLLTASVLYATAGALALRIPRHLLGPDFDPSRPRVRAAVRHVLTGLVDGLQHLASRRVPATALLAIAAHRFWFGLSTVSLILLYRNHFHSPGESQAALADLGVAILVSGAGFVTAAFVTPPVVARTGGRRWILILLAVAAVVQVFPGALFTKPALLVAAFVLGVVSQGIKICVDTFVQSGVDDAFRGRVFALYDVLFNVAFVAAAATAAVVLPLSGKSYPVAFTIAGGYALTALAYRRASL